MTADELIRSRQYLSHIGLWPTARQLDIEGWLANYAGDRDPEIAEELLEAHVHLNEEQIIQAVAATIRSLSAESHFGSGGERRNAWASYLDRVIVSFPLAQEGDPTGSGYIFARLASEKLGFSERQVHAPEQLIRTLAAGRDPVDLIMLDDITASGTQFSRSWKRRAITPNGRFSLAELAASGSISTAYYLPVVATAQAKVAIESDCRVKVVPTYLLSPDYSAIHPESRLVRPELRSLVAEFLARNSPRTGRDQYGDAGYGELALALSFHHGCPNNTLPVLQWGPKTQDWTPLVS